MSEVSLLADLVRAVKVTGAMSESTLMEEFVPLVETVITGQGGCVRTGCPKDVVTLEEAQTLTGRSRNYFKHAPTKTGGRSRLEAWEAQGDARQAGAIWIISLSVLESEVTPWSPEGRGGGDRLDEEAILADFMP